jgi:DNA-binding XRE family transcriptional regulator
VSKKDLQQWRESLGISRSQMEQDISGVSYQDIVNIEKWGEENPVIVKKKTEYETKIKRVEKYLSMREQIRKGKVI